MFNKFKQEIRDKREREDAVGWTLNSFFIQLSWEADLAPWGSQKHDPGDRA